MGPDARFIPHGGAVGFFGFPIEIGFAEVAGLAEGSEVAQAGLVGVGSAGTFSADASVSIPLRVPPRVGLRRWLLDDNDDHLGLWLNRVIWPSTRSVNADYRGRDV